MAICIGDTNVVCFQLRRTMPGRLCLWRTDYGWHVARLYFLSAYNDDVYQLQYCRQRGIIVRRYTDSGIT